MLKARVDAMKSTGVIEKFVVKVSPAGSGLRAGLHAHSKNIVHIPMI